MKIKNLKYLAFALTLTGCFSAKLLVPSQNDLDRVQLKYPGYTLVDLNRGKSLYEQNCGSCHGLKKPTSRTEEQWNKIVPRMVLKTNKKKEVLTPRDQEDILKYVITMGTAPKTK